MSTGCEAAFTLGTDVFLFCLGRLLLGLGVVLVVILVRGRSWRRSSLGLDARHWEVNIQWKKGTVRAAHLCTIYVCSEIRKEYQFPGSGIVRSLPFL